MILCIVEFINTNKEIIGVFINSIIILIAVIAIIDSKKQFNKNININKIEEIYQLCELLSEHYYSLLRIYNLYYLFQENCKNNIKNNSDEEYEKEKENYFEYYDKNEFIQACRRLEILTKAYLNNDLQRKVLSYIKMFRDLFMCSINKQWMYRWKEGFPDEYVFNEYLDNLGIDFVKLLTIKKQNLKNLIRKNIRNYTEVIFKKDIGLKE